MNHYTVRSLSTNDFAALAALETDVFGAMGEQVLCPHYLRLCTEIFAESCFLALDGEDHVRDGLQKSLMRALGLLPAFFSKKPAPASHRYTPPACPPVCETARHHPCALNPSGCVLTYKDDF